MLKVFKLFYFTFLFGMTSLPLSLVAMQPIDDMALAEFALDHPEINDGDMRSAYLEFVNSMPKPPLQQPVVEPELNSELSAEDRAVLEDINGKMPAIMGEVQQAIDQSNVALAQMSRDLAKGSSNSVFALNIGDHFELGLYKNDLARFVFQGCDFAVDKFLFNQMQNHYQQRAVIKLKDKALVLLDELSGFEDGVGMTALLKSEAHRLAFAAKSVDVLNINYSLSLKWLFLVVFNLACKHYLAESEKAWMGNGVFNSGYAATSAGDLCNECGASIDEALDANFGCGGIVNALVAAGPKKNLEDLVSDKINGIIENFKKKKIRISAYPLIDFLIFGHLPVDIRIEDMWKSVIWSTKFIEYYWCRGKCAKGVAFLDTPYFFAAVRFIGLISFLRSSCMRYKYFLTGYINQNMHLFLEILNDIKFKSSSAPESYAAAEKRLRDFIKKGCEVSFEKWKSQKTWDVNSIFFSVASLSSWVAIGTVVYAVWKWRKS